MENSELRKIPQTGIILENPRTTAWIDRIGRPLLSAAIKNAVDYSRKKIQAGGSYDNDELYENIDKLCRKVFDRRIRPLINATGVVLHTNMGRSPIAEKVWDDCRAVNTGYSNLELSLHTGKRGKRNGLIPGFIRNLTGAESCAVVNNNAAAVMLMLNTFASGREVIVSRGEQVQIGGGFRIPEILSLSGAVLVEVGATNITTVGDYLKAVTENTAMVLKVHRSNFALRGFASEPSISELAAALPSEILLAVDQGSGVLNENLAGERPVKKLISDGADLVSFSGDKIAGGPQAGIIAGRKNLISDIDSNPLIRTMRPGKTIYSLLETSLLHRMNSSSAESRHSEATDSSDIVKERCRKLKRGLAADKFRLIQDRICLGGGSTPDRFFDSWAVEIVSDRMNAEKIIRMLREAGTPVIGTIKNGKAVLNPLVFSEDEMKYVKTLLKELEEKI